MSDTKEAIERITRRLTIDDDRYDVTPVKTADLRTLLSALQPVEGGGVREALTQKLADQLWLHFGELRKSGEWSRGSPRWLQKATEIMTRLSALTPSPSGGRDGNIKGFGSAQEPAVASGQCTGPVGEPHQGDRAWLIEWPANRQQPVRYWHPTEGFVIDPNHAVRFARQADADAMRKRDGLHGGAASVEHIFGLLIERVGQ
jgi:hypothetical protein